MQFRQSQKAQAKNSVISKWMARAALMAIVASPLATAQDAGSDGSSSRRTSVLEEIVVTATKRAENLQDVGIAVTALSGQQMEALGFNSAQQVSAFAPGVSTVQPNGESNYSLAIRGVSNSDFTTNVESPVAIYLDEVYISQASGSGFALFDMERVEILRGPQGTLFGRNATGGLAHFIARKPSQELNGYAKLTYGDYAQIKFEGAVGIPLGQSVAFRASISTHENDGYITNRFEVDGKRSNDLNNADDIAARLQLLIAPASNFDILFSYRTARQDIATGFFENVSSIRAGELTPSEPNTVLDYIDNDGDVYAGEYDDPGFNDLEVAGYSATMKWAVNDQMNLTSITDFSTTERTYIEDSDASPVAFFNFFLTTDAEQSSQEIRLDYKNEKLKWVVGGYYLKLDIKDANGAITEPFISLFSPDLGLTTDPTTTDGERGFFNPYTSALESISFFGQIEYALSDTLSLIAGLRFIKDEKKFNFKSSVVEFLNPNSTPGFNATSNLLDLLTIGEYAGTREDNEIAGRLQLDWKYSDTGLVYVAFNRGVRGGGFNAPIFPLNPPQGYDDPTLSYAPEQLDAYEIGYKVRLGDIGRLNAAFYYYDYSKYQLFSIVGIDTITVNADKADAKGFEIELQLTPDYRWDILLGFAYNDVSATLAGERVTPVQSPEINVNALVRYSIPIGNGDLSFQFDADYRDKVFFSLTGAEPVTQEDYVVGNVSVSYTFNQQWRISAFVQNVFDEEYLVQTFDLSSPDVFGLTEQYYGRPRWWGVSVRFDF